MARIVLMEYVDFYSLFNFLERDWEYILAENLDPPMCTLFG